MYYGKPSPFAQWWEKNITQMAVSPDIRELIARAFEGGQQSQEDRIKELEGEVSHLKHINKNWSISEGWALQRVAELEKELEVTTRERNDCIRVQVEGLGVEKQSKPYGWVKSGEYVLYIEKPDPVFTYIPLYTTPQIKSYRETHEGFSTIQEVIAKNEAIPGRKEAIDKAREWLKDYSIEAIFVEPQTKQLSDAIEIVKEFQGEHELIFKAYEDTYADGWTDACNEILWAIEAKVRREK
jgi:hypothetical protein